MSYSFNKTIHLKSMLTLLKSFCNHYLTRKTFEKFKVQPIKAPLLSMAI